MKHMEDFTMGQSHKQYSKHLKRDYPIILHITNKLYAYAPLAEPPGWNIHWDFESNRYQTLKIMNLLSHGNYVSFATGDGTLFPIGRPGPAFIETQQLSSLKYILEEGYSLNKYMKSILKKYFTSEEAAREYLKTQEFLDEMEESNRFQVLINLIQEALVEVRAHYEADQLLDSYKILEQTFQELGIPLHHTGPVPQTVTPLQTKVLNPHLKFYGELKGSVTEWQGAYYSTEDTYRYDIKPVHQLEADLVNTWLYQHNLHEPTREELEEELKDLYQQFHIIKVNKDLDEIKEFAKDYDRMLELQFRLGIEAHGNIEELLAK